MEGVLIMSDKPKVKLTGVDGNAFVIMGVCRRAWIKAGNKDSSWLPIQQEMKSSDHDHLIRVAMKHFDVR